MNTSDDKLAHAVSPRWSELYNTPQCEECGKWAYRNEAGEWKHGGTK